MITILSKYWGLPWQRNMHNSRQSSAYKSCQYDSAPCLVLFMVSSDYEQTLAIVGKGCSVGKTYKHLLTGCVKLAPRLRVWSLFLNKIVDSCWGKMLFVFLGCFRLSFLFRWTLFFKSLLCI